MYFCMPPRRILVATALLVATGMPAVSQADPIGTAASVENSVSGTQQGNKQKLSSGDNVFQDESVQTDEASRAHLLFLDETKLSIGPVSKVVLDRFVYDPNGGVGNVTLQLTKGSFRFITGTQDKRSYNIKTPVATIGVRG